MSHTLKMALLVPEWKPYLPNKSKGLLSNIPTANYTGCALSAKATQRNNFNILFSVLTNPIFWPILSLGSPIQILRGGEEVWEDRHKWWQTEKGLQHLQPVHQRIHAQHVHQRDHDQHVRHNHQHDRWKKVSVINMWSIVITRNVINIIHITWSSWK